MTPEKDFREPAPVLRLPITPAGRDLLRFMVKLSGGWKFGDGTRADQIEWDSAAVEAEQFCAEMERDRQEAERSAREAGYV